MHTSRSHSHSPRFDPHSPPSTSIGSGNSSEEDIFTDYGFGLETSDSLDSKGFSGSMSSFVPSMQRNQLSMENPTPNFPLEIPSITLPPIPIRTTKTLMDPPPKPPRESSGRLQVPVLHTKKTDSSTHTSPSQYKISIKGVPEKSRVETQIKMCIRLEEKTGATVQAWPCVKLDPILVAPVSMRRKANTQKQKQLKNLAQSSSNQPTLLLKAEVLAATPPNHTIQRCYGCIQREFRSAERKVKRRKTGSQDSTLQMSLEEEQSRILQFYCDPILNFSSGEVILPTRITCYCRHHKEPTGFIVRLYLYNQQTLIASGSSPVIMITDDHKSSKKRSRPENDLIIKDTDNDNDDESHSTKLDEKNSTTKTQKQKKKNSTQVKVEPPVILHVIPSEGPMTGGIEITVLGSAFKPDVRCLFGENEASKTRYWGEATLITTLPPSNSPGPVLVSLRDAEQQKPYVNPTHIIFTYVNTADRQLLELALQVIGMKLNGRIDNPAQIAMQIVHENQEAYRNSFSVNGNGGGVTNLSMENIGSKKALDSTLIENAIRFSLNLQTDHSLDLSLQTKSGHHMLHLGVYLGYTNVVDLLLQNISFLSIDLADKNGWTALHFAAFCGREETVKSLLDHGASPLSENEKGELPRDLTQNTNIKALLKEKEDQEYGEENNQNEHVINIDESADRFSNTFPGKKLEQLPRLLWSLFWGALVKFWWNYRVFIYIGLLAATGAWTLVDYVPTILGTAPSPPVVVYPPGVPTMKSICNPPTSNCGSPEQIDTDFTIPVDPVQQRIHELAPLPSLESYLLNWGQFTLFIVSLMLIVYHFNKQLGPVRFWAFTILIIIAFLIGSLFIFDIV